MRAAIDFDCELSARGKLKKQVEGVEQEVGVLVLGVDFDQRISFGQVLGNQRYTSRLELGLSDFEILRFVVQRHLRF